MGSKISDLDQLAAHATADEVPIVDKSDTTQAATGTTKRIQRADLVRAAVINETTTARTLALADEGHLVVDNGASVAITIDPVATTAYPVGWSTRLFQKGAGVVTVVADTNLNDSPVIINGEAGGSVALSAQYGQAYLAHVASNVWLIAGDVDAVQPGGAVSSLLLDAFPGASFAWSVRKLRSAYAGACLRVRRSVDSAEQDIGFSGEDMDTAAMEAFITVGFNGFGRRWHDQSGNGFNLEQTTQANQFQIVSSGVIDTGAGSRPAFASNTNRLMSVASIEAASIGATATTAYLVIRQNTGAAFNSILTWIPSARFAVSSTGADLLVIDHPNNTNGDGRVQVAHPAGWLSAWHLMEARRGGTTREIRTDDVQRVINAAGGAGAISGTATMDISAIATGLVGSLQEIVIWPSDMIADRAGIVANINAYYSIF